MKQKNKSTIFRIIIVILIFMALLYVTEKKQHRTPIAKETKRAITLVDIVDYIAELAVNSTTVALQMYALVCLYLISIGLNRFGTKVIRVDLREPIKKRIKRYKKNRNEQI